jgi:hypothetical protein
MKLIPFELLGIDIARAAPLMLCVVPIKPGPVTVTIAGEMPGGNWILPAGLVVTVFSKF